MPAPLLNTSASQRLDLTDLQYIAQDQPTAMQAAVLANFATHSASDQRLYILHGFTTTAGAGTSSSSPPQNQLLISPGAGILAWRRNAGTPRFGMMADLDGTDQAAQGIDQTFNPTGTYVVWLRMTYTPSNSTDRTFWASGEPGREYSKLTSTRLIATWEIQALAQGSNPGAEWVAISRFNWTAPSTQGGPGTISNLQDTRPLYFEGQATSTPAYASEWGSAADRTSNRGSGVGIKDLRSMIGALKQCLEDLKGPGLRRWWDSSIGGINVGFTPNTPTEGRIALGDASFYLQGRTPATAGHAYLTTQINGSGQRSGFDFLSDRTHFQVAGTPLMTLAEHGSVGFGPLVDTGMYSSPGRALVEITGSLSGQHVLRLSSRAINNASPANLDVLAYICAPDQIGNLAQILFGRGDVQGPQQVMYQLGKAADNSFIMYDSVNAAPFFNFFGTSRTLVLQSADFRLRDVQRSLDVLTYASAQNVFTTNGSLTVNGTLTASNISTQSATISGWVNANTFNGQSFQLAGFTIASFTPGNGENNGSLNLPYSSNPPSNPQPGAVWFRAGQPANSNLNKAYIYAPTYRNASNISVDGLPNGWVAIQLTTSSNA